MTTKTHKLVDELLDSLPTNYMAAEIAGMLRWFILGNRPAEIVQQEIDAFAQLHIDDQWDGLHDLAVQAGLDEIASMIEVRVQKKRGNGIDPALLAAIVRGEA